MTLFSPRYSQIPECSAQGIQAMPPRVGDFWVMTGGNWAETQRDVPWAHQSPFPLRSEVVCVPHPTGSLCPFPPGPTLRHP